MPTAKTTAVAFLSDAASRFDGAEMALCAASVRRQLGRIVGGDEGRQMVAGADAWMAAQEIRRPDRMAELYAPGFTGLE